MPKNYLIAPDKISNKTTQFKTLELKTFKSVGRGYMKSCEGRAVVWFPLDCMRSPKPRVATTSGCGINILHYARW